jgi:hypothetical protein
MPSTILEAELQSVLVRAGTDYWRAKCGERPFPARVDFDPLIEVPGLVPYLMLKDVQLQPLDFRYRLIGTGVRNHLNHDLTGRWMTDIPGQGPGNPLWDYHERVVETRAPVFLRPAYLGPHKEFIQVESVILPLGADDQAVDMLMIFADFLRQRAEEPRAEPARV